MTPERSESAAVRVATLLMAAMATIALEQALIEPGGSRLVALAWSIGIFIVPTAVCEVLVARRLRTRGDEPGDRFDRIARGALLAVFAWPFLEHALRLVVSDRRAMGEVILLEALRNLGLGLAALGNRPTYARLSAVVSLFLVTVATPVGGEAGAAVIVPVVGFASTAVAWLMLIHWSHLGPQPHGPAERRRPPLAAALVMLGFIALAGAVAALGPARTASALAGLVPTSGGTDWSDPEARSGVNDGDNEVAGSENPRSVGFTETDIYLETDRPSLYDAFNESYGEPFKKIKQERMIALGPQNVIEQKERPAENLQAGREFAAVRRRPSPRDSRPGERAARALVFVKGSTPLHLPLSAYARFDGKTWHEEPPRESPLGIAVESSSTWMRLPEHVMAAFTGRIAHQVKIGTLDSSSLPLPPHVARFRIGAVNRPDFFGWAQPGILRMKERTVPAGTVIQSEARTLDREQLLSLPFSAWRTALGDLHLTFGDAYAVDPRVLALARDWVAGVPEGWAQVQAITEALRRRYTHDRAATASPDSTDVAADFLLVTRRGPDYLFATAAAVMLRSLGYPTRVVSGLYAAPGNYDPRTRHTPITADDVHVWVDVRLPDGVWVSIEPTPGYDLMPPVRSWTDRLRIALVGVLRQARQSWVTLLGTSLVLAVTWMRRREILDILLTLAYRARCPRDPRRCVLRALRLVERRASWSGRPRPACLTPRRWYGEIQGQATTGPALQRLIGLADWAVHGTDTDRNPTPVDPVAIRRSCDEAVALWTVAQFRLAFRSIPGKVAPT
ncbi:MAG: transglutaminase-like domain-containing protein [Isosphaeraceae bacterium]